MDYFRQDKDGAFWQLSFTVMNRGPMWLNVHGVGHDAHQDTLRGEVKIFQSAGFAAMSLDESQKRGYKNWSGLDPMALVHPREVTGEEKANVFARLPETRRTLEAVPDPAP